jgi:CBS domain containing-hemolysin-like protein
MAKEKSKKPDRKYLRWVMVIAVSSFILTIIMNYISDSLLEILPVQIEFIILIVIVLIGIVADMIGIAVASVRIEPFNAMASKKVKGAQTAVTMVRHARELSNLCNDVIGDICGIISGATAITIIVSVSESFDLIEVGLLTVLLNAVVASITVSGKAIGKHFALVHDKDIVFKIAAAVETFTKRN